MNYKLKVGMRRHAPTLLTVISAVGVVATAVLAVKATPKASYLIEHMDTDGEEPPTKLEIVKETWELYIPAIAAGLTTIICIFSANGLNRKQQTALVGAYTMLDRAYKEYQAKVVEMLGEDGEIEVRKDIARAHYKEDPLEVEEGKLLFYDFFSGTYFNKTLAEVIDAEYQFNRKFAIRGYVTVGEWYDLLGLEQDMFGEVLGWSIDSVEEYRWIDFEHELATMDDGLECYIIHMSYPPYADFIDYY